MRTILSSRKLVFFVFSVLLMFSSHMFSALASTTSRLATNPAKDLGPIWSPDGTTLAFLSDRNGNREGVMGIWAIAEDGSNLRELAEITVRTSLSWHEAGIISVAWLGDTGDMLVNEQHQVSEYLRFQLTEVSTLPVVRTQYNGTSPFMSLLLTMPGGKGGSSPTASPSGSHIAWTASVDIARTRYDVRAYDGSLASYIGTTDSAGTLLLRTDSGGYAESREALAFSPDGTRLCACAAMSGWPNGQGRDLYVIDLLTSAVTRITTSGDSGIDIPDVTWSSENVIAFCAGQRGSWGADSHDLYTIRPDGTGLRQLTDTAADEITPNWSPYGTRLAYASNDSGDYDIYIMEVNETPHTVTVIADPAAGGTVTGGGTYDDGANVTVVATPNTGYEFVNWTEAGVEVSTSASRTFIATADHSLVAHFALHQQADLFVMPGSLLVTHTAAEANVLEISCVVGNAGPSGVAHAQVQFIDTRTGRQIGSQTAQLPPSSSQRVLQSWELSGNMPTATTVRAVLTTADCTETDPTDNMAESESLQYWYLGGAGTGRPPYALDKDAYSFANPGFRPTDESSIAESVALLVDSAPCSLNPVSVAVGEMTILGGIEGIAGHCWGMAASSIVYWERPDLKPIQRDVYTYQATTQEVWNAINRMHALQTAYAAYYMLFEAPLTASELVQSIRTFFGADTGVVLHLTGVGAKHAVVPYGLLTQGGTSALFLYDPNFPLEPIVQRYARIEPDDGIILGLCYADHGGLPTNVQYKQTTVGTYPVSDLPYDVYREFRVFAPVVEQWTESTVKTLCEILTRGIYHSLLDSLGTAWVKFTIGSPIEVVAIDSSGRQTGWSGGAELNEIPGAIIEDGVDTLSVYLPRTGQYMIRLRGTDSGTAHLTVYGSCGSELRVDYFEFAVSPGDCGAMPIPEDYASLGLSIDDDCNGSIDRTITPAVLFPLGGTFAMGDINSDGRIDLVDVRLCAEIGLGTIAGTSEQRTAADLDADGDVDVDDARILAEYVVGIRTALP